jgi:hypothetical protein
MLNLGLDSLVDYLFRRRSAKPQPTIFDNLTGHDKHYPAKEFLNSMYRYGRFARVIDGIVSREDIIVNDEYCLFPDYESDDPMFYFEGVKFVAFTNEYVISEAACSAIINEACVHYLRLHPEDTAKMNAILQARLF